jgi:hypothetical protein
MDLPILVALNSGEIAEALRDYVLLKHGRDIASQSVTTQVSYNFSKGDSGIVAAVHVSARPNDEPARRKTLASAASAAPPDGS